MSQTICGADCANCMFSSACAGCLATEAHPFGGECPLAVCASEKGIPACASCGKCGLREGLLAEIRALPYPGCAEVKELYALPGGFVNLEIEMPAGKIKLLDDSRIYLGTQLEVPGSKRCIGIAGDREVLYVTSYGENGADAKMLLFKERGGKI